MPSPRAALAIALAILGAAPPAGARLPALAPCRVEGVPFAARCGSVEVFEDRRAGSGRRLALHVVVLPARSPTPLPDPVVYLAGGPGVGATTEAALFAGSYAPLGARHDVVLLDLRGTGRSNPLDCDLGIGMMTRPVPESTVAACRRTLEARADLRFYGTAIAMDDLDEVRAALGYPAIDLFAASYGTLAAQVYIRRHGERVRAAVLQGVVPREPEAYLDYAADAERALGAVLAACAEQPACHAAFPRPREELAQVLDRLARQPVRVALAAEGGKDTEPVTLTRDLFASTLRVRLYSARAAARVPRSIHRAFLGDYADMAHAARTIARASMHGLSEGLMLAVDCTESLGLLKPEAVVRRSAGTFLGPEPLLRRLAACRSWPRGEALERRGSAMPSAAARVPALLLSGAWDPVTPPAGAERVARTFAASRHLVVRDAGHALDDPCSVGIAAAFLDAGTLHGLDASCLERRPRVVFATDP